MVCVFKAYVWFAKYENHLNVGNVWLRTPPGVSPLYLFVSIRQLQLRVWIMKPTNIISRPRGLYFEHVTRFIDRRYALSNFVDGKTVTTKLGVDWFHTH